MVDRLGVNKCFIVKHLKYEWPVCNQNQPFLIVQANDGFGRHPASCHRQ